MEQAVDLFGSDNKQDKTEKTTPTEVSQAQVTTKLHSSGHETESKPGVIEAFQASARAYRPQTFSQVVGQEDVVKTLTNAVLLDRLPHAVIFTGIRGTGKTTIARLLAKVLNCENRQGGEPCNSCANCHAIGADNHVDVVEMDAASRTSIEDIREIIEVAKYKPINGSYKIYIIDEVHMLSKSAFNGLLKTLEEPPSHVKFIFATTDIHKVPKTVLSRCMRFDLQRVSDIKLLKLFSKVAKAQGATFDDESLNLIVHAAGGSARDGLSILDQAILLCDKKIEAATVRKMLGVVDNSASWLIVEDILKGEIQQCLTKVQEVYDGGIDPANILTDLAEKVHLLTSVLVNKDYLKNSIHARSSTKVEEILAKYEFDLPVLVRYWQILVKGIGEVKLADWSFSAMRMVLIRLVFCQQVLTPEKIIKLQKQENTGGQVMTMEVVSQSLNEQKDDYSASIFARCVHRLLFDHDHATLIVQVSGNLQDQFGKEAENKLKQQLKNILAQKHGKSWHIEVQDYKQEEKSQHRTLAQKDNLAQQSLLNEFKNSLLGQSIDKMFGIDKVEVIT